MSARESAAQREQKLARAAAGRDEEDSRPRRSTSVVRTRPVRLTVDMPPPLHRDLKRWANEAAAELDVADVPAAAVIRVLVGRLVDGADPGLADAVLQEIGDLLD